MKSNKFQAPSTKHKINSKHQAPMTKSSVWNLEFGNWKLFGIWNLLIVYFILFVLSVHPLLANEINILYTGETHAMLYTCNCQIEPDGGVARRATLVKKIRKENPDTLLLDSGGFFAGGLLDEFTQNIDLDTKRTLLNIKAMEVMKYDALAIGDDEFNFNSDFLFENIKKTDLAFLSCDLKSDRVMPYLIKEAGGIRVGIIGLTPASAADKAGGLEFIEPISAVKESVEALRKKNSDIIILLSHQGEQNDLKLLEQVGPIDILIVGHTRSSQEASAKIGSTIVLRPYWQGRHLGKLWLKLENKKIIDYKVEDLRLSDQISDDPEILSILPACFADNNCKMPGMVGKCAQAGTLQSQCLFNQIHKVSLTIVTPKNCRFCDVPKVEKYLRTQFPGLASSSLDYPNDPKAKKLVDNFKIKTLPAYFLGREVKEEKNFNNIKNNVDLKGDFYMLKPEFSGVTLFLEREKIEARLDLFISLYDKDIVPLLEMVREFNPFVHFIAGEQDNSFSAPRGNLEIEEYLRCACVQKYYPEIFFDYLICRGKNINSFWWEDCLAKYDSEKIKNCARGNEAKELLRENIKLNKDLMIAYSPIYLLDNREIFGIEGVPKKEEFKKLIKR